MKSSAKNEKKSLKKVLAGLLLLGALIMSMGMLAGCGSQPEELTEEEQFEQYIEEEATEFANDLGVTFE